MQQLVNLLNLLQITRNQPQYGYALGGGNARLGNLAEHHYLVTMTGWQLASLVNSKGAKIDTLKVIKFCLLHDIGELFGGDIGAYYAKANPKARGFAKQFEEENQKFLSGFFVDQAEMTELTKEILNSESDEAHIAKIADYLEVNHYKLFNNSLEPKDLELIAPKFTEKIAKLKDKVAKTELTKFVDDWLEQMSKYDSFLDASTQALKV